jgi:hypothetical protein
MNTIPVAVRSLHQRPDREAVLHAFIAPASPGSLGINDDKPFHFRGGDVLLPVAVTE